MNVDNINRWIEAVRTETLNGEPFAFDMGRWISDHDLTQNSHGHTCGTAACLGGAADMLAAADHGVDPRKLDIADLAAWTGVPEGLLDDLFYPRNEHYADAYDATPAQGARVLELLRDTRLVQWDRALAEA